MIGLPRIAILPALTVLFMVCLASVSAALAATEINWENLKPKLPPLDNPLAKLDEEHRFDIETISWARGLTDAEKKLVQNRQGVKDAKLFERQFKQRGHDVDELLQAYAHWTEAVAERGKIVNDKLLGQAIRLAGYLLPLEFSETGTKDFLLVPYVGACIHVPPPPPNQIVIVRLAKSFTVKDLFTPVWVTGRLQTKLQEQSLTLVDGTADIPVGYYIENGTAEVYPE